MNIIESCGVCGKLLTADSQCECGANCAGHCPQHNPAGFECWKHPDVGEVLEALSQMTAEEMESAIDRRLARKAAMRQAEKN